VKYLLLFMLCAMAGYCSQTQAEVPLKYPAKYVITVYGLGSPYREQEYFASHYETTTNGVLFQDVEGETHRFMFVPMQIKERK
jgi:hypothetical protein